MKKKKVFITKCPDCGSRKYVLSVFGAICPDCFYKEKPETYLEIFKNWDAKLKTLLGFAFVVCGAYLLINELLKED